MSYTLFFNPDSANIVVRMALEELGAEYVDQEVPRKRSDRSAAFFAMNPRGLLPVLIDHDTNAPVFETAAILLYLADEHGRLAPSPTEPALRGACLSWLFMLSNTLHADLAIFFYPERYAEHADQIPLVRAAARRRAHEHFKMVNDRLGETGGEWLLPSGFSVCDIYLGCCVRWAQIFPADGPAATRADLSALPALAALLARAERRPAVQSALEKEGIPGPAFIGPISVLPPRAPDGVGAT